MKLHDHLLSIPLYENTPSDKDLSSLAKQVSSTLGENSDDELSLFPLPMPDLCLQSTSPRPTKPAENTGQNDNQSAKLSERNEETPVLSMNPKGLSAKFFAIFSLQGYSEEALLCNANVSQETWVRSFWIVKISKIAINSGIIFGHTFKAFFAWNSSEYERQQLTETINWSF